MIRLESLPIDVQFAILSFLEPLDILGLRKTCKTFQCATSERTVWIGALRRVCLRDTIFMPTFPVHDMSLAALEYAATGPERFIRTMANCNLLKSRSVLLMGHTPDGFIELFLVPGGRYLVTVDLTRVAVWDLGIPGYPPTITESMEPVSSRPTPWEFRLVIQLVHPTEDGQGLTILVCYEIHEILRFSVFRIYLSDEFPLLLRVAEVDVPHPPDTTFSFCSLSGDKVMYLVESTLNVWDYLEDAWASISVPSNYEQIIVSESAILLPYRDRILVWKIPPLSKSKPMFSGFPLSNATPSLVLDMPNTEPVKECRGPGDWYSGSPQRILFDFAHGDELESFEVVHTNENFNDAVVASLGKYPDVNGRRYKSCRFSSNTLVSWWTLNEDVQANMTSIPSTSDSHSSDPIDSTITLISGSDDVVPSSCSLCPFSGRFAYVDDWECVKILDYFSESFPTGRVSTKLENSPFSLPLSLS